MDDKETDMKSDGERLVRIETLLEQWMLHQREMLQDIKTTQKDHESRLRWLSKFAWGIPPALIIAVLGLFNITSLPGT